MIHTQIRYKVCPTYAAIFPLDFLLVANHLRLNDTSVSAIVCTVGPYSCPLADEHVLDTVDKLKIQ